MSNLSPTNFVAHYRFDGLRWICQFDAPDIATFGRTMATAQAHARSLLCVFLELDDLDVAGIEIEEHVEFP